MTILAAHKGHTVTVVNEKTLRCQTCAHTLLLALVNATSTSRQPPTRKDECSQHRGEWANACRCCAGDAKGVDPEPTTWRRS